MASAGWEFNKVLIWDGAGTASSDYTDRTLEAQSPAGTSFSLFPTAADTLYLGHAERFDMAIFDIDTAGSLGALTWEYYNGSAWTEFIPSSGRFELDPDDNQGVQYDFSRDGAEIFPQNVINDWATTAINSSTLYWIRVSPASVETSPTIRRIQNRPFTTYCTTQDVFNLLQLNNVTGTTDFTTTTIPSKKSVELYIHEAQAYIDMATRKSWRPVYIHDEYHEFNLNGMKLDKPDAYKILSLKIWNGAEWDIKTQGRKQDFFLVPDTGMVQFSRYFLLPARFTSYNAPVWRWGGGEFTMPIKITYLAGRDINMDYRQGGIVQDVAKKLAAMDVMRSADFGNLAVSGMDRISISEKMQQWQEETEDRLDFIKAFEVF